MNQVVANRLGTLALILALTIPTKVVQGGDSSHPNSAYMLSVSYQLWSKSGFGKHSTRIEVAAWIIHKPEGYECSIWPSSHESSKQKWNGSTPKDIVAIAHTHTEYGDPRPSSVDVRLARRIGLPIYAISRKGIWRVSPDGKITQEADNKWYNQIKHGMIPLKLAHFRIRALPR